MMSLIFFVPFLSSCGHPATRDECGEIARRMAELTVSEQITDKKLVEDELKKIESSQELAERMSQCIGNRITDGAMKCVRQAKTADKLESCFR